MENTNTKAESEFSDSAITAITAIETMINETAPKPKRGQSPDVDERSNVVRSLRSIQKRIKKIDRNSVIKTKR